MTGIHNKNKKGFTIIETIIAIGLFSALVTIAVGGFVNALHTQRQVANLISAQSNVSLAVEQMAREMRTGYLFCHNTGSASPLGQCNCQPNGLIWTCQELSYFNAQSEGVTYSLSKGSLLRSNTAEQGGAPEAITGSDVFVKYLSFVLRGQTEGDHYPPFVTLSLGVSPSSTDPAIQNTVLHFETSVSARQIDCDPTTQAC